MRADQAALQLGPQLHRGCAGWPARRSRWRPRSAASTSSARASIDRAAALDLGAAPRRQLDPGAVPGHRHDVGRAQRTGPQCRPAPRAAWLPLHTAAAGPRQHLRARIRLGSQTLPRVAWPGVRRARRRSGPGPAALPGPAERAGAGRRPGPGPGPAPFDRLPPAGQRCARAATSSTCPRSAGTGSGWPPTSWAADTRARRRCSDWPAPRWPSSSTGPATTATWPCCTATRSSTSSRNGARLRPPLVTDVGVRLPAQLTAVRAGHAGRPARRPGPGAVPVRVGLRDCATSAARARSRPCGRCWPRPGARATPPRTAR